MIQVPADVTFVPMSVLVPTLSRTIALFQAGDPLAPLSVLAPTRNVARALSRSVARERTRASSEAAGWGVEGGAAGLAGVRFLTLDGFADGVLSSHDPTSVRRRPPAALRREAARKVVMSSRRWSTATATSNAGNAGNAGNGVGTRRVEPPVLRVLTEVFASLRSRSEAECDAIAESSRLGRDLVSSARQHEQLLASVGYTDERAAVEQAVALLRSLSAQPAALPPVIVVLVEPPLAHEFALLEVLAAGSMFAVGLATGDDLLDGALRTAMWGLGTVGQHAIEAATTDRARPAVQVVVAPDPDVEARLAVSAVLEAADRDIPFWQMAILHPGGPYQRLLAEHLVAAGVPLSDSASSPPGHSALGRFVTSFVQLLADPTPDALVAWWSSSPVLDPASGTLVPAGEWSAVLRAARLGRSPAAWVDRLAGYFPGDRERVTPEQARSCQAFVKAVVADLEEMSAGTHSWTDWVCWLVRMIDRYLADDGARREWPVSQRTSGDQVLGVLQGLVILDELEHGGVDTTTVLGALVDALASRPRVRQASGVTVDHLVDAAARPWGFAVVCGLVEGVLPGAVRRDPLRAAVVVPGEEPSSDRARRALLHVMQGSGSAVLSCAMADQRGQRASRPSPWLLEQATKLASRPVSGDELYDAAAAEAFSWLTVVPSFTAALRRSPTDPMTDRLVALDLWVGQGRAVSGHELVASHAGLRRGLVALAERDGERWSAWDGFVGGDLVDALRAGPSGVTSLERYASCPFRYFLQSVLGVAEGDDEADPLRTMSKHRGLLVHAALETFWKTVPARTSPEQRWSGAEREQLHDIADRLFDESRQAGHSPEGLMLEVELTTLQTHLDDLLDEDEVIRRTEGLLTDPADVEAPVRNVVIDRPSGVPVVFRGRIDRIDRSLDGGRVVAVDYKTGSAAKAPNVERDPVAAGKALQLAVYARALAERHPNASVGSAYWYVTDATAGAVRRAVEWNATTESRLKSVVDVMATGIEGGAFPLVPGDEDNRSYVNCRTCPYDRLCPVDRGELWTRKAQDAGAKAFRSLDGVDPIEAPGLTTEEARS